MKRFGFTLAEVLITLGIIGVVAAMTLPSLIAEHRKQVYTTSLKKAINVTSNMFSKMQADEGTANLGTTTLFSEGVCSYTLTLENNISVNGNGCEDYYGNPSVFERIVPQYLKVVKTCKGTACNDVSYKSSNFRCDSNNKCSLNNITDNQNITGILSIGGDLFVSSSITGYYANDGIVYYFAPLGSYLGSVGIVVAVDVNGEKGPNQLWRDLFIYMYDSNGKIKNPHIYSSGPTSATEHLMSNGWKMDY